MNRYPILGLFAIMLLGGTLYPAMSQLSPSLADHIVINEIETNPPGDDSKSISEWVELYNPTSDPVDIGNWEVASTNVQKKTLKIASGTIIPANGFRTFQYATNWFLDIGELVQLRNSEGTVIDQTPIITDLKNDFTSWQRILDGLDTDSSSDWKFETFTAGLSNGKITSTDGLESSVSVQVTTDRENYVLGETVQISGKVSEKVFVEQPSFQPAQINIIISGLGFLQNIVLYPDYNLNFNTEMKTSKVLNTPAGAYTVFVEYADATSQTQFSISKDLTTAQVEDLAKELSIGTDKPFYIPGETVKISAFATEIIPFEGMKFRVINPAGKQIFDGTLFPNQVDVYTENAFYPKDTFFTTIFMNTVEPTYGKHTIFAIYGEDATQTSFELVEDVKEDTLISLTTDKPAYALGETVTISGRSNKVWISSFDLEILQTGLGSLDTEQVNILKVLDAVFLKGDGTFEYNLKIPNNPERYGDYRVMVSKDIGSAETFFFVVENPDEFIAQTSPLTISTDKSTYDVGDPFIISGKVSFQKKRSSFETQTVSISITKADGAELIYSVLKPRHLQNQLFSFQYSYTAVPDIVGNFEVKDTLYRTSFDKGTYVLDATYGDLRTFTSFAIEDPADLSGLKIIASTDKEVYGIGEEVNLTGRISSFTVQSAYAIILTKPDGDTNKYGATIDKGQFSWKWKIPNNEKSVGVYKITIDSDTLSKDVFFKVSANPEQESERAPLEIATDKVIYSTGETVTIFGSAVKQDLRTEGLVVPQRPHIIVKSDTNKELFSASVDIDAGEKFQTKFSIPHGVFGTGTYKVRATYYDLTAETFFEVVDVFDTSGEIPLVLIVGTDKETYHSGDIVHITGRTSKIVFLDRLEAVVIKDSENLIDCGSVFTTCGAPGSVIDLKTAYDPTGRFSFDYKIAEGSESLGTYTVKAKTEFDIATASFEVVIKPPEEVEISEKPVPEAIEVPITISKKTIDKFNRIPEASIPVSFGEKTIDDIIMSPRVLQGSLRVFPGDEPDINIRITTDSGVCIIGQSDDCKVKKSTRGPGKIFEVVEIDGINYNVRYSGPDVRLEKFTIHPESKTDVIPDSLWNVEVVKDEGQFSRFYYKISYVSFE